MITERLVEFLHGIVIGAISTRDARLRPRADYVCGVFAHADRAHLTVLLPEVGAAPALENLRANGRIGLTLGDPVSHGTYQFKGRFVSTAPATADEDAIAEVYVAKAAGCLAQFQLDKPFQRMVRRPAVGIVLRVEEIYDQTPGPRAGSLLSKEA